MNIKKYAVVPRKHRSELVKIRRMGFHETEYIKLKANATVMHLGELLSTKELTVFYLGNDGNNYRGWKW